MLLDSLNSQYFPNGEIQGNRTEGFEFIMKSYTPLDSIILQICILKRAVKDDLARLESLLSLNEPKTKPNESIHSSAYALFCLWSDNMLN